MLKWKNNEPNGAWRLYLGNQRVAWLVFDGEYYSVSVPAAQVSRAQFNGSLQASKDYAERVFTEWLTNAGIDLNEIHDNDPLGIEGLTFGQAISWISYSNKGNYDKVLNVIADCLINAEDIFPPSDTERLAIAEALFKSILISNNQVNQGRINMATYFKARKALLKAAAKFTPLIADAVTSDQERTFIQMNQALFNMALQLAQMGERVVVEGEETGNEYRDEDDEVVLSSQSDSHWTHHWARKLADDDFQETDNQYRDRVPEVDPIRDSQVIGEMKRELKYTKRSAVEQMMDLESSLLRPRWRHEEPGDNASENPYVSSDAAAPESEGSMDYVGANAHTIREDNTEYVEATANRVRKAEINAYSIYRALNLDEARRTMERYLFGVGR